MVVESRLFNPETGKDGLSCYSAVAANPCIANLHKLGIVIVEHEKVKSKVEKKPELPFWKAVLSVIQASFGVQSKANKERDFESGKFGHFVAAALIFTLTFILSLAFIVKLVLNAQA